ncbi:MAG: hypothetical protein O2912_04030, partial [Proteobacteria bacterium]|nr:hypothetical protein [Pseudomonadota bacterium]
AEHLARSKAAITRVVEEIGGGNTVVVLGAGSCFDVPVEILSERFDRVNLVDAVHLRLPGLRRHANIEWIVRDISGVAELLVACPSRLADPPVLDWLSDNAAIDLVVSLNLVSQLSVMPLAYVEKRSSVDEESANLFHKNMMARHFNWLQRFHCPTLVLCDASRTIRDKSGAVIAVEPLLEGMNLDEPGWRGPVEKWIWPVAPPRERRDGLSIENEVRVYRDRG